MSRTSIGALAVSVATVVLGIASATPATAAENINREVAQIPAEEVIATCSDGSQIGLGFDLVRNIHLFYDDSGELLKQSRNVNYTGHFVNFTSGATYDFHGTRIVTLDYVSNTFQSRGNYRTVTVPGSGAVFRKAGEYVRDLETGEIYYHQSGGPNFDEFSEGAQVVICSLFGLTA